MSRAMPCLDCVSIHGDRPADWLAQWPEGAEYRPAFQAHLCDGCADERQDNEHRDHDLDF